MSKPINSASYQGRFMTPDVMDSSFEPLDDDLKMILGNRYEDCSHLFTPEARQKRRNNRLRLTGEIAGFCGVICGFLMWAEKIGFISRGVSIAGIIVSALVVGYNAGVCVCKNRGYWGPMI